MGCGKTREVVMVSLVGESEPVNEAAVNAHNDTVIENGCISSPPSPDKEPEQKLQKSFTKVERVHQPNNEEIGKQGEDNEAGIIFKGYKKKIENSLEFHIQKIPASKKLPPIKNPPRPMLIPSTLSKFSSHKPDMSLINDLLNKEKNFGFEDLQNESIKEYDEESFGQIMKDLSLELR